MKTSAFFCAYHFKELINILIYFIFVYCNLALLSYLQVERSRNLSSRWAASTTMADTGNTTGAKTRNSSASNQLPVSDTTHSKAPRPHRSSPTTDNTPTRRLRAGPRTGIQTPQPLFGASYHSARTPASTPHAPCQEIKRSDQDPSRRYILLLLREHQGHKHLLEHDRQGRVQELCHVPVEHLVRHGAAQDAVSIGFTNAKM